MMIFIMILIILLLVIAYLLYRCYVWRSNVKKIADELELLKSMETNQLVTLAAADRECARLSELINDTLQDKRNSIIAMNRLNNNFRKSITSLSHDLRTPLTTAGGYLEMLHLDVRKNRLSEAEREQYFNIIAERQEMVRKLLEQLFEYARLEAGEIVYKSERIDLRNAFTEVLSMYYEDFSSRGMEPQIDIEEKQMWVMGDTDGMKRVFSNIIYNSLVHGSGSYAFYAKEKDGGYEFAVANASEPLTAEDLDNIFQRFFTKDTSRAKKTTGLGLSIAREITLRHNGRTYARYNNGILTIYVWLPMAE